MAKTRLLRMLALLAALALLAVACGGGETQTTGGGGESTPADDSGSEGGEEGGGEGSGSDTLVVGALEVPSNLDPAVVYEKFASDVLFNTTNRLVEFPAGETEVGPGLAEDWEISEDGLTYTFTLREGVTFHDGSEMDSEDVKFSLDRAININHPDSAAFLLGGVESVEAPDPQTVVITIAEPNVTFLSRLNYTVASILPSDSDAYEAPDALMEEPTVEEADAFLNNEEIIGTGPYKLAEYTPGETLRLEKFDDYWGEQPAQIPNVVIQFFESSAQMKNALAAGEIDLNLNEMSPPERTDLEETEGVVVYEGPGARIRYIVLDVTQEPWTDPEVRRALSASIDRQRIIDEVFEGAGTPLFSMIPSGFEANADFMSDIEVQLDEPVEIELWYPLNKYGDTEADVAETIKRSLEESGNFTVTTQSADWASEYSNNLNNGTYGAYLLGWYPDYFDPDDYIEPFYHSEKTFIGFYGNEQMDQLIAAEQAETDQSERVAIFEEIQQLAAEDMPFVPLYEESPFVYYREGLSGVEQTVDPVQQFRYWLISKE